MTRPPHTHNPAYRPRQTLLGSLVLFLVSLGLVALLAAPVATLATVVGVAVVGSGLRTALRARRRAGRQRTVCLPLAHVCITV